MPTRRQREEIDRALRHGLEAAPSIQDRRISTFVRGELPHFAGETGTFLKAPFLEDVSQVGDAEVAIFGVPLDAGTTYRPGTRFGPRGIRRVTIPANIEKSFDQISRAMSYVVERGVFPVVLGGDHSIGYPTIRGLAPWVDGTIGIIHLDRHVDTQERDLDERMHTTPWFHATNIPNAPAANLVQIGIGGWQAPRPGVEVGRARGTTIVTVGDVERVGVEKVAEVALEVAWKGATAVYLSFDVDVIDSAFVPGTGWPEPGGLLPREALQLVRLVAAEGLAGLEVVECSPPYDHSEQTSLIASRVILDALAVLVREGHLGHKVARLDRRAWGPVAEGPRRPGNRSDDRARIDEARTAQGPDLPERA